MVAAKFERMKISETWVSMSPWEAVSGQIILTRGLIRRPNQWQNTVKSSCRGIGEVQHSKNRFLSALRAIFVPLASLAIRQGIASGPVVEQLKIAFVEAARKEHGRAGKPASVNRTSQLTGIGRKQVSELLRRSSEAIPRNEMLISVEAEILSKWWTSPEYLNDRGLPIDLEMGPGPGSFTDLVRKVTGSDSAQMYLGNLTACGSVGILEDGQIQAIRRDHPLGPDLARIICAGPASLTETISKNWGAPAKESFIQGVAHTNSIDSLKVSALRQISRKRVTDLLENIDDIISSFEQDDDEPIINPEGKELLEVGVGAYYFEIEKN